MSTSPVNRVVIDTMAHFTHVITTPVPPREDFDCLQLYHERFQQQQQQSTASPSLRNNNSSSSRRPQTQTQQQQRCSSLSRRGSAGADRKQPRARSGYTGKQKQQQQSHNVRSFETLALQNEGDCSPWESGGDAFGPNTSLAQLEIIVSASKCHNSSSSSHNVTNTSLHMKTLHSPPRSPSALQSMSASPDRRGLQYKQQQAVSAALSSSPQRSPTIETKQQQLLQMRSAMLVSALLLFLYATGVRSHSSNHPHSLCVSMNNSASYSSRSRSSHSRWPDMEAGRS